MSSASYSYTADLVRRLREQASAGGHVWVDVMILLLEAANALEPKRTIRLTVPNDPPHPTKEKT